MSFMEAIQSAFSKWNDFTGRSRRSEYWYFFLFNIVISVIFNTLTGMTGLEFFSWLSYIYSLVVLVPGIAVSVRRMHDIGKSGWNLLWSLLPCVGGILLLIWLVKDSEPGANMYGSNPKGM